MFNDPEVQYQMLPMPKVSNRPGPYDSPKDDPKGLVRKEIREKGRANQPLSNCQKGASKTCQMENQFAMHSIRTDAPSQRKASVASAVWMCAGSVSNQSRTPSVRVSDYPVVLKSRPFPMFRSNLLALSLPQK